MNSRIQSPGIECNFWALRFKEGASEMRGRSNVLIGVNVAKSMFSKHGVGGDQSAPGHLDRCFKISVSWFTTTRPVLHPSGLWRHSMRSIDTAHYGQGRLGGT